MCIESYGLIEHFDYMRKYIPQPFFIDSESFVKVYSIDDEYHIKTKTKEYSLTNAAVKKLVSSLGIKLKLLQHVCDESDVMDLALPAVNKLFKCFADCFVFYASNEDALSIIDLNVNNVSGPEGTKYENGPSPWKVNIDKFSDFFTVFSDFLDKGNFEAVDGTVKVKADDLMPSGLNVSMNLFIPIDDSPLQPMLSYNGKCSNMNGFSDIHVVLYHPSTEIGITFPMNYTKRSDTTFPELWRLVLHIHESVDLDDYIFREANELAASNETPTPIKNILSKILTELPININQPIKDILVEVNNIVANESPAKAKRFKSQMGSLIGWCLMQKHSGCTHCGHINI